MKSWQVKGSKSPLFCLHGWGQSHQNMEPLASLLKSDCAPYLFDLPGFGQSPPPDTVWSADDYADHFIAFMDANKIESASFLGHSFGGKISMSLAELYPDRIKQLILLAPSGLKPRLPLSRKIRRIGIRTSARLIKAYDKFSGTQYFSDYFIPKYGSRDYQNANEMRSILVKSVNEDYAGRVKNIQCPTLLLWGEKDKETPLEMGVRLAASIPNCQLVTFPYHGHYLADDVGAHLMAATILPFLKEAN